MTTNVESALTPRLGARGPWPSTVLRFVRRWPLVPAIIIVLLIVAAVFAPLISPADPIKTHIRERNTPPFWAADALGNERARRGQVVLASRHCLLEDRRVRRHAEQPVLLHHPV